LKALHVRISERAQTLGGGFRQPFTGIAHDDAYGLLRQQRGDAHFEMAERHVGREQ
jgi:hypothetical protein